MGSVAAISCHLKSSKNSFIIKYFFTAPLIDSVLYQFSQKKGLDVKRKRVTGQHDDVIRGDFKLFGLYRVWVFHSIAFSIVCYHTEPTDKAQKL